MNTKSVLFIQTLTVLKFLLDHKCVKTNVNVFGYFLQIGLEFSKISLKPLAKLFSGFSKAAGELQTGFLSRWGAAAGFSKPAWGIYIYIKIFKQLQQAALEMPAAALENLFAAPQRL